MPIELAHATAMPSMPAGTTFWTVAGTVLTCRPRRSNKLDMYAEQIVLSSNSTCRIRFHLCKETMAANCDTDKPVAFSKISRQG